MRRIKLSIIMALLFSSLFMFASTVQLVKAPATTIYIMADGSINPSTANITTSNRITYTFTRNNYLPIVVQRSNIIIDGRGYTLQASVNVNGFSLSDVNNVTIRKTTITNCFNSVYLLRSSGNTISENKIISNRLMGIFLYGSSNNIISGNNITANDSGILLGWGSSGNTISKNNVTLNYNNGIWLYSYSDRNTISYNNVNYNSIHNQAYNSGIMVEGFSSRNMITGNEVHYNPRKEIELYGGAFYNTIIGNNVSDGSDLIEIWLASGNTAIGNNVTRAMWNGFVIAHTSNITLIGNRATAVGFGNRVWPGGAYGIAMENCSNCRVSGNYASANSGDGIYFGSTTGSTIVGNTIEQNGYSGIEFDNSYRRASSNNNITSNRIADNNASIRFVDADNNVIYHNDFINNQNKPQIDSASTGNAWNVAYPSGGNYWSDYTGVDQKSGPNQNLPGSDGIGDTPYVVNGSNRDNYPLMSVYNKLGLSASVSPSSATLDVGQSQLFTSTVSGGTSPYTYQWYLNNVAVSGGTSSTWTFTPASSGSYTIYVNVTDSVGFRAKSKIASVTVNYALSASILPSSATLNVGQSQLFTSSVSGGTSPFGYQWYVNGATVPGETSSTYTYTSSAAGSFSVYVRVTDSASVPATAQSNTATVTVSGPLTVSISPASWTMDVGQSKTFTATASGGSGSYSSYQWYVGSVAQSGQTVSTFSYSAVSVGSPLITVTVTDSLGATSAQSSAPSVTVNPALVAPTVTATRSTVDQGQTSSLTSAVVSTGTSPYSYQWFQMAPNAGSYSQINGATSSSYNFATTGSIATGSWSFELQVTDNVGAVVTSSPVSVTVNGALSASILPSSATLNVGQSQLFTSSVSGGTSPFGYQWYVNGATVPGETSSTYTYTSSAAGSFSVYVRVTDSASVPATAQSNTATVTVNSLTTVLFSDGFESGNFGAWRYVFGTPSIVTSPVYSGTYAAYAATSGNGAVAVLSSAQTSAYVQSRFYITPQATAWTVMDILRLSDTTWSNTISNIQLIHNTGNQYSWALSGSNNGIIETVSQPFTLTTATWVTIRVETYIDASTGYYKLYVNDVLTLTLTGKDTNNFGGVQSVYCGALWSNSPWVLGWDDFSIGLAS